MSSPPFILIRRAAAFLPFVCVIAVGLGAGCAAPRSDRVVRAEIRRQLGLRFQLFRRPTVDQDDVQPLARRFYRSRDFRPAWTNGRGPTRDAETLVAVLREAPADGLDPAAYRIDRLDSLMKSTRAGMLGPAPRARRLAILDVLLTRTFFVYAAHRATGQVDPKALPADWHVTRKTPPMTPVLENALLGHRVKESLARLAPNDPRYAHLRQALARYRAIAAAGGWTRIPAGPPIRRGERGPRVAALRARLAASGDLARGSGIAVMDAATEAALRRFQQRHGLTPDGIAGEDDIAALDVPVARRIRQIELNMERWRWIPANLGDRYLMVNIPAFMLELDEASHPTFTSRVVVGKQLSRTPMFSDVITYLVINPYWNIPSTIAANEVLASVQEDPFYLERKKMHVYDAPGADGRELDPTSVDWESMTPEDIDVSFRQEPGADNPVGHVKFMCPNQFDVYLHDTPAGHLFDAGGRDLSHGCVRVERSVELAERLLDGAPHSARVDLLAAFASGARDSSVRLPRAMPVYLFYWTAWVDDAGGVQFRDDVYGLDAVLEYALGRRGMISFRVAPRTTPPSDSNRGA